MATKPDSPSDTWDKLRAYAQGGKQSTTPAAPSSTPATSSRARMVALSAIVEDKRVWPRAELDTERVKLFRELYANDGDILPAIELAPYRYRDNPDTVVYIIVDGWHRYHARKQMHAANIPAIIREDLSSLDAIYIEACRRSGVSSKPLTTREKREAVKRILDGQKKIPERERLSDREIARIVGCSHPTVASMRNPVKRFLRAAGDALTDDGKPAPATARSIEQRAISFFTNPRAQKPDVDVLTKHLRNDANARAAVRAWAETLVAAYNASAPTSANTGAGSGARVQ